MNVNNKLIWLLTIIVNCNVTLIKGQVCGSSNLPINKLINVTELVVVGKVIDQQSFWHNKNDIYTKHTIAVKQSSNQNINKIFVITEGGTVDDITFKVYGIPNLTLYKEGVFFLNKSDIIATKTNSVFYNLTDFAIYNEFTNTLENVNTTVTLANFNNMMIAKHNASFYFNNAAQKQSKLKQVSIASVSPITVAGGNNDIVRITGDGFGSLTGSAKVAMRSPASLNPSVYEDIDPAYIISWTDRKIEFIVPGDEIAISTSGVASGKVKITNQLGDITTSTQTIEVIYNKKVFNGVPVSLRSKDNDGRVAYYVEQLLIDDGALPAIKNALKTWNCTTGSNFVYAGAVANVCKKYDGLNVICYDASIATTTLGSTRVVSRNCSSIGFADQLDADIRINPNIDWCFTDAIEFSQFHFESVMMHELGHAFMLGHVVNELDIMYPTLTNNVIKSEPTNNDLAGGVAVMSNSTLESSCSSYGAITANGSALECSACSNISNINIGNLTENSAYLSWEKIANVLTYQLKYRFNGAQWYNYSSYTNDAIFFDLPPCATVECQFLAHCSNDGNSINETFYTFTTLGCQ